MFDNFCSLFSNKVQPGQYAYQTFQKVPSLNVLIQAKNILSELNGRGAQTSILNGQQSIFNINNASKLINNVRNWQKFPTNKNFKQISQISKIFESFKNNTASNSIKASEQNLQNLVQNSKNQVIKKLLKSNYSQLIQKHQKLNTKFTDNQFPPILKSIGNVEGLIVNATWKRISEVIKNPQFVSDKIQPSDILQGSIGDCYFLSAVSALAENDFRIKNLFPDLKINPHGIYMARILYQGILRQIVVDDFIPVTPQGSPLFAKPSGGNQIWVMILQKCWAKLHGSYGAIVGGLPNQVLHAFSGAPTYYRPISQTSKQKQQQLWFDMFSSYQNGAVLCCGTKGQSSVQNAGLVLGHAYTIINIYENPYRLIKIRNPWGNKEWNGRASDKDTQFWSSLSNEDKRRLNHKNGDDGTFFILWQDFINYFDMVDICKIKDNASYLNVDTEFSKKNGQIFQFETSGGNLQLSLSQPSLRGLDQNEQKRGYARSTMIVARQEEAAKGFQYKFIQSSSSKLFSQHSLELLNLSAGKYVVFAKFDWVRSNSDKATLSIYSESKSTLKLSKQSAHPQFLFKVFLDHARNNPRKQIISQAPSEWLCSQFLLNKGGYGYLAIHLDQRSTKKIGIQINEKQYIEKRLTLKKPYKGQGVIKTMLQPGKQLIIPFKMKAHNYPSSITLPSPKIYSLV